MSEPTEREWLEGLRYEDKFPETDEDDYQPCPTCGEHWALKGQNCPICAHNIAEGWSWAG